MTTCTSGSIFHGCSTVCGPVPTRWHSHVDESDRVRAVLGESRPRELDAILTLHRGIHVESRRASSVLLLAKQPRFGFRRRHLPVGSRILR